MQVKELMTFSPKTIGHDISVTKAKEFMEENQCHHLPVLDGGRLVGVLSTRDLELLTRIPQLDDIKVEELMTEDAVILKGDSTIEEAAEAMLKNKIHSVLVENEEARGHYGILTSTDMLKHLVTKN